MKGFLTALLPALPLIAAAPSQTVARDDNPGCQARSFNDFQWTVEEFDYHASYIFTTPAHQNSWGYVNFNLTNPALTYEATCSGASNQLSDFFYGTMIYHCTVPDPESPTGTTFAFSRPSGQLDINQTWVCSDEDPQYPVTINGYGTVNLTLDCTDETWQNPDWKLGQIYSSRTVTCGKQTFPLKPYQMTAVA
jgi:hypothetical protein